MPKASQAAGIKQRSAVSHARRTAAASSGKSVSEKDDRVAVDRAATIRKLVRGNPKRGPSARRFEFYADGMTIGDYIKAVQNSEFPESSALEEVLDDISRGLITIVPSQRPPWTVPDAKARLSEILRLAREGKPQTIGAYDPCVVLSAADFERLQPVTHLGQFLIDSAPRGVEFELPSRVDDRGDPFGEK